MSVPRVWRVSPQRVCALAPVLASYLFPSVLATPRSVSRCWGPSDGSSFLWRVAPCALFRWLRAGQLAPFLAPFPQAFPLPFPLLVPWWWGGVEVCRLPMTHLWGWDA